MKIPLIPDKRIPLVLHIAAWAIILVLPLYLLGLGSGIDVNFLMRVYSHVIAYALLFYMNIFWFIPKFYLQRRKIIYFLSVCAAIIGLYVLIDLTNRFIIPENRDIKFEEKLGVLLNEHHVKPLSYNIHIFNYLLNSILICGFSLGLKYIEKNKEHEKELKELEKERLNTELAFLKNQVSPHFFFNTLNNIYSLIQINTDDAQKSVLKLSKLMRYLLYESEHGNTTVAQEIEFMKNYIDLMRLRLNDKVDLQVSFSDKHTNISISPLLFVPFVENAFKHGISYRDKSFIHITMEAMQDEIKFTCKNSIALQNEKQPSNNQGLGLENVKKRLSLLYPGCHELSIEKTDQEFSVLLNIKNSSNKKV